MLGISSISAFSSWSSSPSISSMSKPDMMPELRASLDRGIANMARLRISSFMLRP